MGRILDAQKQAKRQALMDAAYELFLKHGTGKTTINDIVEQARVAKGTFYLYFGDKDAILQALSDRISHRLLSEAYEVMDGARTPDFSANVVLFIDAIIESFKRDPLVLRVVERKFSWPIIAGELTTGTDPLFLRLRQDIQQSPIHSTRSEDEIMKLIFMLIELCGSVCYSSIIEHRPAPIDEMKPVLYDIITKNLG